MARPFDPRRRYASLNVTLQLDDDLGYTPLFTAEESFRDIRETRAAAATAAAEAAAADKAAGFPSAHADVDWHQPPLSPFGPQRVFDILSGPAATGWETALTLIAMLGACAVAYDEANPTGSWTTGQCVVAGVFAVMDGAAAVQCCTAQSKRWYHEGGKLSSKLVWIIWAETVVQVGFIGYVFIDDAATAWLFGWRFSLWYSVAIPAIVSVPLHAQRPTSLLLFLASAALALRSGLIPVAEGVTWLYAFIFPLKYLVAHLPRAEPYIV